MTSPPFPLLALGLLVQRMDQPGWIHSQLCSPQLNLEKTLQLCTLHLISRSPISLQTRPIKAHSPTTSCHHTAGHHHLFTDTLSHQKARLGTCGDLHGVRERRTGGQPVSPEGTRVTAAPVLDDIPAARAPQQAHGGLLQELGERRRD